MRYQEPRAQRAVRKRPLATRSFARSWLQLVHDLAAAWDGKIITPEGLRPLDIRLAVDLDDAQAWWVIPSVTDVSADLLRGTANGVPFEAIIATDRHTSLYHAETSPGRHAVHAHHRIHCPWRPSRGRVRTPESVRAGAQRADAGGWVSVDAIQPYEEHAFIVAADAVAQIQRSGRGGSRQGLAATSERVRAATDRPGLRSVRPLERSPTRTSSMRCSRHCPARCPPAYGSVPRCAHV